jgi:Topoisomerase 6 subunit A/Spo11, Toprim domain
VSVADDIAAALKAATRDLAKEKKQRERDAARARRYAVAQRSERETTLKEAVFEVLEAAVAKATGNGAYTVSARTLYYQVRSLIQQHTDKELQYGYFSQTLLTEYRDTYGPVDGLTYDPRGVLKEPHTGGSVKLGTAEVASYRLPKWTFDKILYVEKKGLEPIFDTARFAERYDMAIAYGEGYAVEAARELLAQAEAGDYTILVLHDADPYGYEIARTLGEATRRMPDHEIEVIDLGLTVADAIDQGLASETFTRRKGLSWQLRSRLTGVERQWFEGSPAGWKSWVCRRVELNAFTAPDLVAYVEAQLAAADATGKIVPPADVLADQANDKHRGAISGFIERYLAERFDADALTNALAEEFPLDADRDLAQVVADAHDADRATWWKATIDNEAASQVEAVEAQLRTRLADLLAERLHEEGD